MTEPKMLAATLDEIEEFLEGQSDVVDGEDGPKPNRAMSLLTALGIARSSWGQGAPRGDVPREGRIVGWFCFGPPHGPPYEQTHFSTDKEFVDIYPQYEWHELRVPNPPSNSAPTQKEG